jgi:hypothetical protein
MLNIKKNISYNGTYVLDINKSHSKVIEMTVKQLLFPTLMFVVSNMIFSMDNSTNKVPKKKDKIRLRERVDKVELINHQGVSTGYMIKNKSSNRQHGYHMSYSPEEKETFLEAYKDYSENYMSPK